MRNINCNSNFSYSDVSNAVVKATSTVHPKRGKAQSGWFRAEESRLLPLIEARNDALRNAFNRRTHQSTARLKQAHKNLKAAVHEAKNKWIKSQYASLNTNIGTKSAWDAINTLKGGLSKTKPSSSNQMKRPGGSLSQTPTENSKGFCDHFRALYGRQPYFDESVLDDLPQHPIFEGCEHLLTDK